MFYNKNIYILLSVIIAVLALYCYDPFALYFQNDDFIHISLSEQGVLLQRNTFRPVCDISIMLDYWLWGKNAWGYHFINLLLHIVACIMFFFFLKFILKKYFGLQQTTFICWLTCVLFFIYAMHSEAIFWILGRSAILAAIFSIAFLFCYLKKNEGNKYIAGYIFFFAISLLTYESSWMLPMYCLAASITEVKNKKTTRQKEATHFATVAGIFVLYLVIRWYYINEITGYYESAALLNGDYTTLLRNYVLLFIRSFLPAFINNKILLACFGVIAVIIAFLFLQLKRQDKKKVLIFFLCYLISLVPYASLGVDTNGTESERFLYFPTLLVCILFCFTINLSAIKKLFQFTLYVLLFSFHIIVLFITADNYRTAGNINKLIVKELEKVNDKKNIYAIDLPRSQNGALILQNGFSEMTKWMFDNKFDTAIVCSKRSELKPLQYPYRVVYSKDWQMNCSNAGLSIDSANSVLLRFTDSAFYITK
ncbi:MAG TPA: hypothetical protein VN958_00075 [Chitinophagaceae bacterium]|nr:hypothetical protein [Chitinophagaceae bacterium]